MAEKLASSGASPRRPFALRALVATWAAVLAVAGATGVTLAVLGPPSRPAAKTAVAEAGPVRATAGAAAPAARPDAAPAAVRVDIGRAAVVRAPGSPIAAPDLGMLEPSSGFPPGMLPRPGADGRAPRDVYAAGAERPDRRPRVAVLVAGMGMSALDTEAAITQLPAAISLAITPYAPRLDRLLELARAGGHELFVSLALEPTRYPLDDPGPQTLLTTLSPAVNAQRLEWTLSRFAGYAGAVGALGSMRGERFALSDQMRRVLQELSDRGLGYVDPRPDGALPADGLRLPALGRVDLIIDDPAVRVEIEAKLARLEQVARDRGAAIGFAGSPAPVTLDRLAAWTTTLGSRGLVLVPVTALLAPPRAMRPTQAAGETAPAASTTR